MKPREQVLQSSATGERAESWAPWHALPRPQRLRIGAWVGWIVVVTLAFIQPLTRLMLHAVQSELHSYIPLVPFVAGYLLYIRRRPTLAAAYRSSIGGTLILVRYRRGGACRGRSGCVASLSVNDDLALMALAYVSLVAAGGFLFLGSRWMAAAAFPVAFLIFMVPLPDAAVHWLETASVLASADVSALFFKITGTPLLRDGTRIRAARNRPGGRPGVQRHPLQLGALHHQPGGLTSLSREPVATARPGGLRDSAWRSCETASGFSSSACSACMSGRT